MSPAEESIRELLARIESAENRADAGALTALLADDVVIMVPDEPVQAGKPACAAFIERILADQRAHFRREIRYLSEAVETQGDRAFDRGSFAFTVRPHAGGERSGSRGKYFFVYSRAGDASWRLARAIVNLESAPESLVPFRLALTALLVRDYDPAIAFFVNVLGFELAEDSPSLTNDGRPKRWVVVRPPGAETGVLLARADGDAQGARVGDQFAGRVGMFLRVADFDATLERMRSAGVCIVSEPRTESYGKVAVFLDLEGNRWDLLGPVNRD
jgi:ketosteroid isomerase-like protein/catechol 2,3-dioxygenase-like lactoylglutathione lyase family enzyme